MEMILATILLFLTVILVILGVILPEKKIPGQTEPK